jgi:hypothetical protein
MAWSVIELFTPDSELITGNFKVPIYYPPSAISIDMTKF